MNKKNLIFALLIFILGIKVSNAQFCPTGSSLDAFKEVTCYGGSDGSLTISFTGGTAPFTFVLVDRVGSVFNYLVSATQVVTNGGRTVTFTGLTVPDGIYYVLASTSPNCKAGRGSLDVLLTQPNPIISSPNIVNVNGCFGDAIGSIKLNASGGNAGSYTYSLNG